MSRDPTQETALVEAVHEDDDVDGLESATASAADPRVTAPVLSPTLPRAASLDALVTSDEYVEAIVEADVDRAVGGLIARAEQRAGEILRRHRPALDTLTERLVNHRAGSSRELTAWLAGFDLFADDAEAAR